MARERASARQPSPASFTDLQIEVSAVSHTGHSLDLRGMWVVEALRVVGSWLDRAALARLETVTIVHGLGSDKLQGAVRRYLGTIPALRGHKVNESIPGDTNAYF